MTNFATLSGAIWCQHKTCQLALTSTTGCPLVPASTEKNFRVGDDCSHAHSAGSLSAGVNDFIPDYQPSPMTDSGLSSSSTSSSISLGNNSTTISHLHTTILNEVDLSVEQDGKVKTLMEFITSR